MLSIRPSTALSASAAVALLADFETPNLKASLIADAGLVVAFDRCSVSRCESLQMPSAALFRTLSEHHGDLTCDRYRYAMSTRAMSMVWSSALSWNKASSRMSSAQRCTLSEHQRLG